MLFFKDFILKVMFLTSTRKLNLPYFDWKIYRRVFLELY